MPQTTQKLKEAGYINAIEIGHTHKDGTVFPMLMNLLIVKDENNQPLYMAATAIDITEKKQLEEKLGEYKERVFQSQKHAYVNAISAIVAHQVNQPLTTVNMLLDRAVDNAEEGSCSPDVVKDMKESLAEIKKAVSIIRKLRQYSKDLSLAGTGRVNVNAVADRIVTMLSERAAQAQMHILKDLDKLPEVKTNEAALEQVFLNIIQNAIDAADGKSRHELKITGKVRDGKIELQFVDDCCGITPEDLDRIFKPFFSTKPSSKGLGLGLDIVQQILINCGGEIRAESRVGKGTTFYVTLPVGEARGL